MNDVSGNRRYLALWFPFLPAERVRIETPQPFAASPEVPVALVEKLRGTLRLASVDARAQALGLGAGIALADARARIPDLCVFELDATADHAWLERLAQGCARYTPLVALDPPDGLVLDITGCAHLFGGEAALAADLAARMARLGLTLRQAAAHTPDAARALARYQAHPALDETAAIRRLPVAALGLGEDATLGLTRAGLRTIGDLAQRPMAALAARFGREAADALRRMLGDAPAPLTPRKTSPPVHAERRFAEPIMDVGSVLAQIQALVGTVAGILEERKAGGRSFEAVLFRSDGLARPLCIETALPTRDPGLVMRLIRERIETLSDPLDPGFGFDMIRLLVPRIEPLTTEQLHLEGGAVRTAAVTELADRLSTRLGRGRVRRLYPVDTHIPERAQFALPAVEHAPRAAWPETEMGEPPLRPFLLFDPPQPIEVIAEVPDGPPHRFRWCRALHEVRRFEGPERIAAEWWRRRDGATDRPGLTRDYYRVEDGRGRRYWIFRHGLYNEKPDPGWYLHGLFA